MRPVLCDNPVTYREAGCPACRVQICATHCLTISCCSCCQCCPGAHGRNSQNTVPGTSSNMLLLCLHNMLHSTTTAAGLCCTCIVAKLLWRISHPVPLLFAFMLFGSVVTVLHPSPGSHQLMADSSPSVFVACLHVAWLGGHFC